MLLALTCSGLLGACGGTGSDDSASAALAESDDEDSGESAKKTSQGEADGAAAVEASSESSTDEPSSRESNATSPDQGGGGEASESATETQSERAGDQTSESASTAVAVEASGSDPEAAAEGAAEPSASVSEEQTGAQLAEATMGETTEGELAAPAQSTGSESETTTSEASASEASTTETTLDGPCGPVLRFELVVDTPYGLCASSPPLHGNFPSNLALSCDGEACKPSTFAAGYTVVPEDGLIWEWDGQVVDQGQQVCTDSIPGSCWFEGGQTACVQDMPAARSAFGADADGGMTLNLIARLASPEGTCTNDVLVMPVAVGGQAGNVVRVLASELSLPEIPEVAACGDVECAGATEYCEIDRADSSAHCRAYPDTCLDDHRCDCLSTEVEVTEADVCSDGGMLGVASIVKNAVVPDAG